MKQFIVDNKSQGKSLFRFIKAILPELKNNEIFKLIRKKIIVVNNTRQDPNYTLKENDIIDVFLKDKHFDIKGRKKRFPSVKKELDIIFQDQEIIVINKPAGLLTHPDKNNYKNNLYEIARAYLFDKGEYNPDDTFSPTPCHRLDRNTSGVIVIAKTHSALQNITASLRGREAIKIYYALVYGKIESNVLITSTIDAKDKVVEVKNLKVLKEIPDKKEFLITNNEISATLIINKISRNDFSLVKIELWTGKKHQIRAHLKAIGHPLLGDNKYFDEESKRISARLKIKNYFLHAYKLKIDGYPDFIGELPEEFKKKIDELFN